MHSESSKNLPRVAEFEWQVERNSGRGKNFQDPNGPFPTNLPLVLRQRENCILKDPKFLNNPGKTCSCQDVNVRDCINCVLIIAGSPEINPGSQNPSPNLPSEPNWQSQF